MKSKNQKISSAPRSLSFIVLILLNIVLLFGAFYLYGQYSLAYQKSLREENLSNIDNMNKSAATIATSFLESWNIKLNDIAEYVEEKDLTYSEACDVISSSNSNGDRYFQIIDSGYKGHCLKKNADGSYPAVDYSNGTYEVQQKAFDDTDDSGYAELRFVPEFTDAVTINKVIAVYKHITLKNGDGERKVYTLLLAGNSAKVSEVFNSQDGYKGQSTVLIDSSGNYIIKNPDFTSTNFFQYLYNSNDLTRDEKNEIEAEVRANGYGELFYKNSKADGQDCVFRYERMSTNDWYCVTVVPESSFRIPVFNYNYLASAVIMLVLLLIIDVTWLQITNYLLRTSMRHEMEANAAKGSFMSRMSHEIRTPLNAVIGYNTIARGELAAVENEAERKNAEMTVMDCLEKSSIASKHLLTIINDVLDMSAIESGKIKVEHERFDFKGLITSLTTVFYSQAKSKGVEFEVLFSNFTEEWFVGDQMRTNQILTNLLSNAVKFTSEGGRVELNISQPELEENESHIHFEVTDTGIGMTPEYLNHIWTPFEQADSSISRRFGGTGLGLSITKNLVDLMGGTITVESTVGKGTKFCVDLTFERIEQPQNSSVYDFGSVNALIVDDDQYTCEYIKQLFDRCGAKCTYVTSGVEAVGLFSEKGKNTFTMCLVDWRMPHMDGIETIKRLRSIAGEELPIIVITAYDFSEISEKAAEIGVNMFLSKPLFQSSLFDLLANVCGVGGTKEIEKQEEINFNGARVLLAEDNAMNMEIARKILETAGLKVDSAWNGEEAVKTFEESEPGRYSAILMDVHMPVMDGHQATKTIRASEHPDAKNIPIIAMTADAFAENVSEALMAGMNDHISKPIDIGLLFETLSKYIKKA